MTDRPEGQWPERELLAKKLAESGKSARKAAQKMRITDTRLRHIINGYQPVGRGQKVEVVAPADTLADIALALEITPEEMAATGRTDAAKVMEKILGDRPMKYATSDRQWNQILAEHEEIRDWAEEGIGTHMPPDAILHMFDDAQLLGEVARRMRYGSEWVQIDDDDEGGDGNAEQRPEPRGPAPTKPPAWSFDDDLADAARGEDTEKPRLSDD